MGLAGKASRKPPEELERVLLLKGFRLGMTCVLIYGHPSVSGTPIHVTGCYLFSNPSLRHPACKLIMLDDV
jgi:hypothetical protein